MGGFRRAMPFTFVTFTIGALSLAGFPLTAGFFSKDEIIAFTLNRGGLYTVLGVIAYAAALVTAFYAFRMVFRVFFGEPVEEARELERGHLAHHDPANPMTGEPRGHRRRLPGPRAPHRRARVADEGGDGAARGPVAHRRRGRASPA